MNERYIYGKLNKEVKPVNYEGEPTDTIEVHVDNDKRTIKADYVGKTGETYVGGTTETSEVNIIGTEIFVDVNQEKVKEISAYTVGESTGATLTIDNEDRTISVNVTGGEEYQASSTDTIDTTIINKTISSNLRINEESFNVGQVVDSIWFDTSLSAEELGRKIMYLFSVYDLAQSFTRRKTAIIGTYHTEEPADVLWFDWEHNVTSKDPDLIGNGTFSIYVRQQGVDITKVVEVTYSWEYYYHYTGGEYIFTYDENDNPHWYSVVVNQEVEMIIQPTITYVDSETGYLWNGEFIKNLVDMLLMGVSNGKVYNSNINKNSVLTTEKQYLTAEQQAQVLENLGLTDLIAQIKQYLGE